MHESCFSQLCGYQIRKLRLSFNRTPNWQPDPESRKGGGGFCFSKGIKKSHQNLISKPEAPSPRSRGETYTHRGGHCRTQRSWEQRAIVATHSALARQ